MAGTIYRAGMKRARRRAIAQSIGNPTHLWRTHAALARFHAARGDKDAARLAAADGARVVDAVLPG